MADRLAPRTEGVGGDAHRGRWGMRLMVAFTAIVLAEVLAAAAVCVPDQSRESSPQLIPQQVLQVRGFLSAGERWNVVLESKRDESRSVLSDEQSVGNVLVKHVSADRVLVAVHDDLIELESNDLLAIFGPFSPGPDARGRDSGATLLDRVAMIALVGVVGSPTEAEDAPRVLLRSHGAECTSLIAQGESAFSYELTLIKPHAAILKEIAGPDSSLQRGDDAARKVSIPDLVRMSSRQREEWVAEWRRGLSVLPEGEQQVERDEMREYWRLQLVGGWGRAVAAVLPPDQQTRLREEISAYWLR